MEVEDNHSELLIDKYRPKSLDELDFGKNINNKLKALSKNLNIPHMILEGKKGSGKKLRSLLFLKEKYGDSVFKMTNRSVTYSNEVLNIFISMYHFQFDPSIHGVYDKNLLASFIEDNVKYKPIKLIPYKIIIIENADNLSVEAQQYLRRTLETYVSNCRFIFLVNKINKLIDPLYSRCVKIICPSPTNLEIKTILKKMIQRMNINIIDSFLDDLIKSSERNLNLALHYLDRSIVLGLVTKKFNVYQIDDVEKTVKNIVKLLLNGKDMQIFFNENSASETITIRKLLYDLQVFGISPTEILNKIFKQILLNISRSEYLIIYKIAELTSNHDNSIRLGSKSMYHLESYVLNVFKIMNKF